MPVFIIREKYPILIVLLLLIFTNKDLTVRKSILKYKGLAQNQRFLALSEIG